MATVNLNKLFPRLTIRAKLTIAFALLAGVPLAAASTIGTHITVRHLRARAVLTLEHDLEMAQTQTARSLRELERHVSHLAATVLGPLLSAPGLPESPALGQIVASYLEPEPTLLRVRLVAEDGRELFVGSASGGRFTRPDGDNGSGMYYAWRAAASGADETLLLPVEVRDETQGSGTIPVVAILAPVRDPTGAFLGLVVGEAYASVLFADIERGTPGLAGETGLVDRDGLYLYHSSRKRDWATLLASRAEVGLHEEFPTAIADTMLSGWRGTLPAPGGGMVSFRALALGDAALAELFLYRVVPLAQLEAPVRGFLRWVAAAGFLVVGAVLGLATVAANQFTKPIYQLREGARRLARGEGGWPLAVATNDELEDLAGDFAAMAQSLEDHRLRLEELVAERTRALQAAHAELADLLAHSADAIIGVDEQGKIRLWNRGAETLFGHASSEAIGREVDQLIGQRGDRGVHERAFIARELESRGAVVNFQTTRVTKSGTPMPVSLTQSRICSADGRPLGSSLILRDHRVQAQLEELMRRSERIALTSLMAAGLAHELNNPLAIVGNRIECMQADLREGREGKELERDLGVLQEHVARLRGLVADLLAFGREDAEPSTTVNLHDLLRRVVSLLERTFRVRDLRLDLEFAPTAPWLLGDPQALETVCVNLLMNAADATPPGGTVRVATLVSAGESTVTLIVSDTGPGVPIELRSRIFEPFFTTKGAEGGTGLGLTLCQAIVTRHGGHIWVESDGGRGSRFVVSLPRERGPEGAT